MFRRRRPLRRRSKRRGHWVNCATADCWFSIPIFPCLEATGPAIATPINLVDAAPGSDPTSGLVGRTDRATVARVVGDFHWMVIIDAGAGTPCRCGSVGVYEGIYLADQDSLGGVIAKNPMRPADTSSHDWLWRRSVEVASTSTCQAFTNDGGNAGVMASHVDFHVKRKMHHEEMLVYAVVFAFEDVGGQGATARDAGIKINARAYLLD